MHFPAAPKSAGSFLLIAVLAFVGTPSRATAEPPPVTMLSFSTDGVMTARSVRTLEQLLSGPSSPTHVFVMSHGWNNTFDDAQRSYSRILAHMDAVATQYSLRPTTYRPLVIGIYWPSKAGSESDANRSASEEFRVADARTVLDPALSPQTWATDVASVNEILALPGNALVPEDYALMNEVFKRYKLVTPAAGEGDAVEDVNLFALDSDRGLDLSPGDIFGLLSFWNKKKLSGTVGSTGVGPLLAKLQSRFADARFHLFGHSFGAKVMLSAITRGPAVRPVSSVVLIQPAISCLAFSPGGGYEAATSLVTGPIVATYSNMDRALGLPYRAASRLAGQSTEIDRSVSGYSAMGSVGPDTSRFRSTRMAATSAADMYMWNGGTVVGVESTDYITDHNEFYNPQTARLIWSAVLSAEPAGGLTRSITDNQLDEVTKAARAYARVVADPKDPRDYVRKFAAAFKNGVIQGRSRVNDADTSRSVSMNLFDGSKFGGNVDLFGDPEKSMMLRDRKGAKSVQMIIDGPSSTQMISGMIDPIRNTVIRNGAEHQCVCIGYKLKSGSDYDWRGTGCIAVTSSGKQVVLTAAHVKQPSIVDDHDVEFYVLIGDCFSDKANAKIVKVRKRIVHPQYDKDAHSNDVAVLLLDEAVSQTDLKGGEPYTLADVTIPRPNSAEVTVVGFGSTDGGNHMAFDGYKRRLILPLKPLEYSDVEAADLHIANGMEFVLGKLGLRVDSCFGDSGGPAYVQIDNKKYLVGCILRGLNTSCGDGSVQLRVIKYSQFIEAAAAQ